MGSKDHKTTPATLTTTTPVGQLLELESQHERNTQHPPSIRNAFTRRPFFFLHLPPSRMPTLKIGLQIHTVTVNTESPCLKALFKLIHPPTAIVTVAKGACIYLWWTSAFYFSLAISECHWCKTPKRHESGPTVCQELKPTHEIP